MIHDDSHALSHKATKPLLMPATRNVARPETMNDIIPDRSKPNARCSKRFGRNGFTGIALCPGTGSGRLFLVSVD